MNAAVLSPEEQIRRVARILLDLSHPEGPGGPTRGPRPDLRGLISMIERHLEGDLPPLKVAADSHHHSHDAFRRPGMLLGN